MKVALSVLRVGLSILVILLLLLVVLPIGMGHMGDCPACSAANAPFALGMCAGILSLLALSVLLSSARFRLATEAGHRFLLSRSIYRPPRSI
ncbi:MAG TPA: hypothetical protein VEV82_03885 [Actinomycetota bacterium]|nr:hypothetical protein [Actinomycetota bacterium]